MECIEAEVSIVIKLFKKKNPGQITTHNNTSIQGLQRLHKYICQCYRHLAKGTISLAIGWNEFKKKFSQWQVQKTTKKGMADHIARCISIFFSAIRHLDKGEIWHSNDKKNENNVYNTRPTGRHGLGYTGCSYEDISCFDFRVRGRCLGAFLGQLTKSVGVCKKGLPDDKAYFSKFSNLDTQLSTMYDHISEVWSELKNLIKGSRKGRFEIQLREENGWSIGVNGSICIPGTIGNNLMNTSSPLWCADTWDSILTFGNNIGADNVPKVELRFDAEDIAKGKCNIQAHTDAGATRKRSNNGTKKIKSNKKSRITKPRGSNAEESTDDEDFAGAVTAKENNRRALGSSKKNNRRVIGDEDDSEDEAVPTKKQKNVIKSQRKEREEEERKESIEAKEKKRKADKEEERKERIEAEEKNLKLLCYPFGADESILAKAALGLKELGGNLLGVEGARPSLYGGGTDSDEKKGKSSRTHYITIHENDVERLSPGIFLNDTLVDFWMRW